jgi:hypothetical protein
MVFRNLIEKLRVRSNKTEAAPNTISPANRKMVADILAGMTAQIRHEQDMIAARGKEPVSVRLVPQAPVRDRTRPRAWIGGGARLPSGSAWPQIDGSALQLLTQIDCAQLPENLWGGRGPRTGWLAIFLDPKSVRAKVLHFTEAGDFTPSPPVGHDDNMLGYDGRKRAEESGYTWAFPCWPVDIVSVVDGRDDPRKERRRTARPERYGQRHDIVDEHCLPFDWATAQMMMNVALAAYEGVLSKWPKGVAPEVLSKAELAIREAESSGVDPEELARVRVEYDERRVMAAVYEFVAANGAAVVERLRELKARVDAMASSEAFSTQAIAPVLAEIRAMTWMHKSVPPLYRDGQKLPHSERLQEGVDAFALPLTTHHPSAAPSWVHAFETRLIDAAKPVYLADPSRLPPALTAFCEAIWSDEAACEIGGMGHVPWRYVHEFDGETEAMLVELPTCYLVGWMFGDVDNLVITVKKADLARNDFSRALVQFTN